ncbi:MAG TPA: DNA polymerase Y family protein [Candidatus Limnocylindria bacterium]|jgi:protein ImuB|nr:DNA polymerase Y family protein [Candidatus Limnocylindria bacterium]
MFAVVSLPQFVLQAALRHEPELWKKPVALVDPTRNTPTVCDFTPAAADAGVTLHLTPTQAMARCGSVMIRHRSPARETAAMEAVIHCAYGFSPHIEATAPGVVTLDLRALSRLIDATTETLMVWANELRHALRDQGLQASVGVGPTPNLARHAARWGSGVEIINAPRAFLDGLPVAALEPSADAATILDKWGIRTVGELLALGQESLADRLGLEALALFSAASTSVTRPLHLAQPAERFEESFEFDPAIETLEPLLFILRRFVDQLCARLEFTAVVAETVCLRLQLENGQVVERPLRVPQPTREADTLFRMLSTHLESVRTEAAILSVGLTISPIQAQQRQFGLFETVLRDPQQFQETLARLAALVGSDRIGTPVREDSHRPDAFKLIPPDFENAPPASGRKTPSLLESPAIRRLRPPALAAVNSDPSNGQPLAVRCSLADGKLKVAIGPWRTSGNWWENTGWSREEWDAATLRGKVVRLVRQEAGWTIEGLVD